MTKTYIRNWRKTMTPKEALNYAVNNGFNVYLITRNSGKAFLYFTCGLESAGGEVTELITDNGNGNRPAGYASIYDIGLLDSKKYACYGAC